METTTAVAVRAESRAVLHESALAPSDVVAQVQLIQHVMQEVMQDGEHYGVIPGCGSKPALLKAGAEKLCFTFRLAPSYVVERHDFDGGHREYEVRCDLTHIESGRFIAAGVGLCSTMESKYRWRKASRVCPKCGQESIIKGKREYGGGWVCFKKKGGCNAKWPDGAAEIESQEEGRVENEDIADVYNTVLKMAKKRAHVDATITATAASDIFTQDIEDLPIAGDRVVDTKYEDAPEGQTPRKRVAGTANGPVEVRERRRAPQPPPATRTASSSHANQTNVFEDPAEQPDYQARAKNARAWLLGLPVEQFEAAKNRADDEMSSWPAPVREMGAMHVAQAIDKRKELERKIANLEANLRDGYADTPADDVRAAVKAEVKDWPRYWAERAQSMAEAVIAEHEAGAAARAIQQGNGALPKKQATEVAGR